MEEEFVGPPSGWFASSTPSSSAMTAKRLPSEPLTPFPPWEGGADEDDGPGSSPIPESSPARDQVELRAAQFLRRRRALHVAMDGTLLVGQCLVCLAVASVVLGVVVWKEEGAPSPDGDLSGACLATMLLVVFAVCLGTLVAHEVRLLRTVVLLYLQALILTMTTGASFALWLGMLATGQDVDQLAKGVAVGSIAMMVGTAAVAFSRAVAVWWWAVEVSGMDDDDEATEEDVSGQ
ncbi:hypothetical protein DCS_01372 [Drechmeria coniospora]|uniref:Transmembrane protein n=1 Tax=Drechmeria coniospora TaxID=98403 RepID=A0A151GT03_DRECN|nr:hypothetical protein DCS_01372 [Drechmeria coniospora]KYK60235.1 hypothetical protein DCS_01372 [Drechmeria coniospora]ODA80177.1 hypothetical protein RJ55_03135 [Drechmeria coniospora]